MECNGSNKLVAHYTERGGIRSTTDGHYSQLPYYFVFSGKKATGGWISVREFRNYKDAKLLIDNLGKAACSSSK